MSEITIDKNAKQITFINNGICFSQSGVAKEILDLIDNLQTQLQQKENIIKEVREYIEKHIAMFKDGDVLIDMNVDELLEILDKAKKE